MVDAAAEAGERTARGRRGWEKTMPDDTLHPDDAAAMREPLTSGRGELRQQLSNAVVAEKPPPCCAESSTPSRSQCSCWPW
jgi:hypothetical protein